MIERIDGIHMQDAHGFAFTQIGPHRLWLGDAYALRPLLGWFDADVLDPPYLFRAAGGGAFRARRPHLDQIRAEKLDQGFDLRIINPLLCGAAIVFCHNDQLPDVLAHCRGNFRRFALCIWRKLTPMPVANKHYVPEIETYVHAWSAGFHPDGELAELKRVVECRSRALKDFGHPTVKPDLVMNKILRNVRGGSVCDPFMGTGSTGVAAIRAGKRFVGIEHSPIHFSTAVRRCSEAYATTTRSSPCSQMEKAEREHRMQSPASFELDRLSPGNQGGGPL